VPKHVGFFVCVVCFVLQSAFVGKFQWTTGKRSCGTKIGFAIVTCHRYGSVAVCIASRRQSKSLSRASNLCRQVRVEPQSGPCEISLKQRELRHIPTASPSVLSTVHWTIFWRLVAAFVTSHEFRGF
jgi:hypothetical protein